MNKEMVAMTNAEMFSAIMARLDIMEAGLNKRIDRLEERMDRLEARMDSLEARVDRLEKRVDSMESRMDKMESENDMEFKAVRTEMDVAYKMLLREISVVNDKVDRLLYMKDIDGYENMKIQVDLLTQGYQELKAKIG